jgi:protein-S-isoprenylcysteine O-methyltransferase Ste14
MRASSIIAFLLMVIALVVLLERHSLFGIGPVTITLQVVALLLMAWARLTFGIRSFHAGANPTEGKLVTTGPYRYVRHPIYAAAFYFVWIGVLSHLSLVNAALGALLTAGLVVRISAEEQLLREKYPEYADYARRTKRIIPFIL